MGNELLEVSFKLPVVTHKKTNHVVSECPVLDVHSQGPNEDVAISNLLEALQLFFETCFEMGTLEEVLKDCGFSTLSRKKAKPADTKYNYLDVPLSLVSSKKNAQAFAS